MKRTSIKKGLRTTQRIKWDGDYWAMTKSKTAEIHKEKSKDGEGAYSIVVFTQNSRVLRISMASTLAEAQEKVKKKLG